MPGKDGLEATKDIKQLCERKEERVFLPCIIGLTGDTETDTESLCRIIGMDRVLHKPMSKSDIIVLMEELKAKKVI